MAGSSSSQTNLFIIMGQDLNRVQLKGTISDPPQGRSTPGGDRIVTLRIATVRRYQKDGEWKDVTNWHRVVCFGTRAETADQFREGDRVSIEGELQTRKYQAEGKPQYITEVNAMDIEKLASDESPSHPRPGAQRSSPPVQPAHPQSDDDNQPPF